VLGAWLYTLLTGRGAALVIGSTLIATVPLRRILRHHGHKLGGHPGRRHHWRRRDHAVAIDGDGA
jgi:hypothetical protein